MPLFSCSTMVLIILLLLPNLSLSARMSVGIVNGTEAKPHSRPYMVSVQKNGRHICGGFLVTNQFVMTAGHCKHEKLTVVVGAHLLNDDRSTRINVNSSHRHPAYEYGTCLRNDIMLLQLQQPVDNIKNVDAISIPEEPNQDVKANSICSIAGWGKQTTNGAVSNCLMHGPVTVIRNVCEDHWKECYNVTSMLCGGGKSRFCKLDSGGPLVCNNTAVGIISFFENNNCDDPSAPNVYTKISIFLPWIRKIVHSVHK
ncbi:granzyme B(G,H)-like [Brachyhypopomus gauderio]|uniref:granzyme B(G,H)-like n=1 Tax=Brachyhypopomus gauderio TaxID=698409 RepID=UPI0040410FC4